MNSLMTIAPKPPVHRNKAMVPCTMIMEEGKEWLKTI